MRTLPGALAFPLLAYAFAATMLGTTLPTPLYPLYQQKLHFGGLMVTVIFAVYAFGVIAALLLFGALSDQVGRRLVLLPGVLLSAASAVVFLIDGSLAPLFVGRVLSGLSAGIFTGTATAALVDLAPDGQRERATLVATLANMGGLGLGPLVAGLLSQYAGLPLRLCFIVDLALLVPAAVAILAMPETVERSGNVRFRPQRLSVPREVRQAFVPASIAGFAGFAVLGLFTAVAPAMLAEILHHKSHALTGVVAASVFLGSLIGQLALERVSEQAALRGGCAILIAGVALVGASLLAASLPLLVAGATVAGFGQGLSFRAGLTSITAQSPPEKRAEVASSFFVVAYVAISIPVIGVGVGAQAASLKSAAIVFSAIDIALTLFALALLVRRRSQIPVST